MPHPYFKKIAYKPPSRQATNKRRISHKRTSRPYRRQKRTWSPSRLILRLLTMGFFLAIIAFLFSLAAFAWYSKDLPDPSNLSRRTSSETTKIYDRTGETLLYEIYGDQKRTPVNLNDIPEYVKQATLVAEDRNFYQHNGFDLKGIIRATIRNTFKIGGSPQGGSTITQQLVKNTIVGGEKTYSRKMRELILAYRIEQRFSKDEILQMYLNSIPYGGSAYGIEAAATRYFGKTSSELTLSEATVLAALPKAPSYLSPYGNNRDRLIARQRYLLNEMADLGYISTSVSDEAQKEELVFVPLKENVIAPHFVFYIQSLLSKKYGNRYVETGGLKIITTLDLYMQEIAEEEVLKGAEKNEARFNGGNAALVALDPKTGQILSMVGSRDYFAEEYDGNVNVATRPRQPGSSFKPIVYSAAFAKGYTPNTVVYDVNTTFKVDPQPYKPINYDEVEHGPVTLRQALAGSLNIAAVKVLYLTGINNVLNLADRLGYSTLKDRSRFGLSLVLGGGEVTLLEHTAAYQAFARDGVYQTPTGIIRVEDANGNILESFKKTDRQALPTNIARQTTSILIDNNARSFVFGPNSSLQLGKRPVAAKTGTTNDYRDGWTIGYTPSLVVGVWAGNNDNSPMKQGAGGVSVAAPIWNAFMNRVLGDTPIETFRPPDPLRRDGNPALYGEIPSEVTITIDKASGKRATDLTPVSYREKQTFREIHSILHYIDINNPTGPAPEQPENDPNYLPWEEGVTRWVKERGEEIGAIPPTEFDDVHTKENQPKLIITSPSPGQTVRGLTLSVTAVASAPRGLEGIKYFLDGSPMGVSTESGTFNIIFPPNTGAGFHTVRIEAYDDVGNKKTIERTFNYIP